MSKNLRHSKIKNTGILFELLSRQITVDVLNNRKNSSAIDIIKKYFNENTELGREQQLYRILIGENYNVESKADKLIEAVISSRQKIKNSNLHNEKYNLIKEIKENYSVDEFFAARIPNYKVYASIYKLFLSETSGGTFDPAEAVNSRFTIIEHIIRNPIAKKDKQAKIVSEYQKQEKDLRLLSYQILVDKFNERYSALDSHQKKLLKEYINNISNTNNLREYINVESKRVTKELKSLISKVDDDITRIKLKESIAQVSKVTTGKLVKDDQVVKMMRYYQLVKEIKKTIKGDK